MPKNKVIEHKNLEFGKKHEQKSGHATCLAYRPALNNEEEHVLLAAKQILSSKNNPGSITGKIPVMFKACKNGNFRLALTEVMTSMPFLLAMGKQTADVRLVIDDNKNVIGNSVDLLHQFKSGSDMSLAQLQAMLGFDVDNNANNSYKSQDPQKQKQQAIMREEYGFLRGLEYFFEEEDSHNQNSGTALVDGELRIVKIDHDLALYNGFTSFHQQRKYHLRKDMRKGGRYFVTLADIQNLPDFRDTEMHYASTRRRWFTGIRTPLSPPDAWVADHKLNLDAISRRPQGERQIAKAFENIRWTFKRLKYGITHLEPRKDYDEKQRQLNRKLAQDEAFIRGKYAALLRAITMEPSDIEKVIRERIPSDLPQLLKGDFLLDTEVNRLLEHIRVQQALFRATLLCDTQFKAFFEKNCSANGPKTEIYEKYLKDIPKDKLAKVGQELTTAFAVNGSGRPRKDTPLHAAIRAGIIDASNANVAKKLVEKPEWQAFLHKTDADGHPPIDLAISHNNMHMLLALIDHIKPSLREKIRICKKLIVLNRADMVPKILDTNQLPTSLAIDVKSTDKPNKNLQELCQLAIDMSQPQTVPKIIGGKRLSHRKRLTLIKDAFAHKSFGLLSYLLRNMKLSDPEADQLAKLAIKHQQYFYIAEIENHRTQNTDNSFPLTLKTSIDKIDELHSKPEAVAALLHWVASKKVSEDLSRALQSQIISYVKGHLEDLPSWNSQQLCTWYLLGEPKLSKKTDITASQKNKVIQQLNKLNPHCNTLKKDWEHRLNKIECNIEAQAPESPVGEQVPENNEDNGAADNSRQEQLHYDTYDVSNVTSPELLMLELRKLELDKRLFDYQQKAIATLAFRQVLAKTPKNDIRTFCLLKNILLDPKNFFIRFNVSDRPLFRQFIRTPDADNSTKVTIAKDLNNAAGMKLIETNCFVRVKSDKELLNNACVFRTEKSVEPTKLQNNQPHLDPNYKTLNAVITGCKKYFDTHYQEKNSGFFSRARHGHSKAGARASLAIETALKIQAHIKEHRFYTRYEDNTIQKGINTINAILRKSGATEESLAHFVYRELNQQDSPTKNEVSMAKKDGIIPYSNYEQFLSAACQQPIDNRHRSNVVLQ